MNATLKILAIEDISSDLSWAAGLPHAEFELLSVSAREEIALPAHYAPDAIILNMSSRPGDGLRLCRLLRGEARFASTPILFLHNGTSGQRQWAAFEAGGNDYLERPVDAARLREKVTLNLARTRARPPDASNDPPGLDQPLQVLHEGLIRLALVDTSEAVLEQTYRTLNDLGLAGAVRSHTTGALRTNVGPLTDLEASLLSQAREPFPLDHSARLLWGSPHLAVLVHNMPHPDAAHFNGVRQMVLTLCNAAGRKLDHLRSAAPTAPNPDWRAELDVQAVKLEYALAELGGSSERKLNELARKIEQVAAEFSHLHNHRQRFKALELACTDVRLGLFDQYLEVETHLARLLNSLHRAADGLPSAPQSGRGSK